MQKKMENEIRTVDYLDGARNAGKQGNTVDVKNHAPLF